MPSLDRASHGGAHRRQNRPAEPLLPPFTKTFAALGAVAAAAAVTLGAFGAHVLRSRIPPAALAVYQTAVQYHLYHALGLLVLSALATRVPDSAALRWSGWLMAAGIVLFSGSLYGLALSGPQWLGAVTPLGGLAFMAAWTLLAAAALRW